MGYLRGYTEYISTHARGAIAASPDRCWPAACETEGQGHDRGGLGRRHREPLAAGVQAVHRNRVRTALLRSRVRQAIDHEPSRYGRRSCPLTMLFARFASTLPTRSSMICATGSPRHVGPSPNRRRLDPGCPACVDPRHVPLLGQRVRLARPRVAFNRFDQFVTNLDGLDIHFVHQRSPTGGQAVGGHTRLAGIDRRVPQGDRAAQPIQHGGGDADAFHVICPTLPGFGFSAKPATTGWGVEKIADAWAALMARLGYDSYFAQGGDWGSAVTRSIGGQDRSIARRSTSHWRWGHDLASTANPRRGTAGHRRSGVLPGMGFGLLQAAGHPPADGRVRPR